jgi:hypothetical protein
MSSSLSTTTTTKEEKKQQDNSRDADAAAEFELVERLKSWCYL